jgi:hypothetical protein
MTNPPTHNADYVVDTNVWVFAAKDLSQVHDLKELDCLEAASEWISAFMRSAGRLIVDDRYEILGEYRRNANRQVDMWLNTLERQPRARLLEVTIAWEENGDERIACLPLEFERIDRSDRKFLAVLFKHCERGAQAQLVNASDTDWSIAIELHPSLAALIVELCPEYIAARRAS